MGRPYRDQRSVSIGTTDTPLLGPNPRRIAVRFSAPPTNRYTISFGDTPAVLDQGENVYPATTGLTLDIDGLGPAICEGIRAISAVGAQNVNVVDVSSP